MAGNSTKAIVAALLANAGIAVAKFVGYVVTGSSSMLAEGVHSVADSANQALLLFGGRRARRDATPQHPFGFGRERYFWSFVVAMVLFTLGSVFAINEGIHKLQHPEPLDHVQVAIGILVLGLVLEGYSFRTAVVESSPLKGEGSWWAFVRRSRSPELPVVLLEDLGALVGLVLALAGVSLASITDDPVWDGVATVAIGTLLGVIAIILAIEMKSLLIGESATPEDRAAVVAAIETADGVRKLIHLRTQHIGPDELLVAAKVEFDAHLDTAGLAEAVNRVEADIRAARPVAQVIYLEPDLHRELPQEQ